MTRRHQKLLLEALDALIHDIAWATENEKKMLQAIANEIKYEPTKQDTKRAVRGVSPKS